MSEFMPALAKALSDQVAGIRRHRRVDEYAAWTVMRDTASHNLADSSGTDGEVYWRAALAVCDRKLESSSDPRWSP